MKMCDRVLRWSVVALLLAAPAASCARGHAATDADTAPPRAPIDDEGDGSIVRVDHPERFPTASATARREASALSVTGVVAPDVSRAVPVVSMASGRIVDIRVRLGDEVRKGQLLLRLQSPDVASAFSDYRKAVADEALARTQLSRASMLFERGAVAGKDLEVAREAEEKAMVDVQTDAERLHVLGASTTEPPTGVVNITAPSAGVITEQNVAAAGGVKSLDSSPNLFTISDLSRVWILCDVYENDLPAVRVGDRADIRLAAYPDRPLAGRVDNIGAVLDATARTAKVRIEVANPGMMRVGMFVTAEFHGQTLETRAIVPATAVLHLHDRDWVYVPLGDGRFARREVVGGDTLGAQQVILSGLDPGQRVVANALVLQNTVEQ